MIGRNLWLPVATIGLAGALAGLAGVWFAEALAQGGQEAEGAFQAGPALELTGNATVYGGFRFAESCSFDEGLGLFVVPSAGVFQDVVENDGYVSLINPDGSVHTLKWIGATRDGLTLNDPFGSDIVGGSLYLADLDHVRWFDLETGEPMGEVQVEGVMRFNDIEVAEDGTIYATQTGTEDGSVPQQLFRIGPEGESEVLVEGAPLNLPNGVAFDGDGNIVVVNIGSDEVLTFSPEGEHLGTARSLDAGNDGLVILPDGTMYVSSVREGTLAVIRPGEEAQEVASGIPSAASICFDPAGRRIGVPMNNGNSFAIVQLD